MQNKQNNRALESVRASGGTDLRPLVPPRRVWIGVASLAAAVALVRAGWLEPIVGGIVDQAVRNIISLILCFSAMMSLVVWFLRESGYALAVKRAVIGGLLGAVALGAAVLRIERVSGDLVPEFALRWSPSRDRLLPQHRSEPPAAPGEAVAAVPWQASTDDFPKFLGPTGSCGIDSPVLDPDWQARPPRLLWKRPIGGGWSGFATRGDHAVTLEQRGDDEIVSCCSVVTGEPEWAVAVKGRHETVLGGVGPRSTPTIHDGVVYAHGATGWLHAIDGATGRVLWKKNVLDELGIDPAAHALMVAWGRAGSPLVTADFVVVPAGGPRTRRSAQDPEFLSLVAFDRATGERRWTTGDEQISYVSPELVAFGGRELIVSVNEAHVAGYDPADGHEIWEHPWLGHSNSDASCSQAVPVGDRRLFLSKGYGIGAAVFEIEKSDAEPWTLREVWRNSGLLKTKFTNVAIHEGHAYGLSDGILECVRLDDGARRWKAGRYGQGQLLRVGPLLLVQAESGEVVLVDASPEKHVVRSRLAAIDGQTWNNICLSGSRLLVRNAEEAACYELPVISASNKPGEPATASEPVAAGPGTATGTTP
jgi:outer membrane protein assembly factor BamB